MPKGRDERATVSVHLNSKGREQLASSGHGLSTKATAKVKHGKTASRRIRLV